MTTENFAVLNPGRNTIRRAGDYILCVLEAIFAHGSRSSPETYVIPCTDRLKTLVEQTKSFERYRIQLDRDFVIKDGVADIFD